MDNLPKNQYENALSLTFNQDFSLFSIGTETGFRIYNTSPFNLGYEKRFYGGIYKCEMSYRSNYLALIGGGRAPKYDNKKVVLYNDALDSIQSEFKFTTPVLNVKLKKYLIFIVCETKIFVFNIQNSQNIDCLDTSINKKGLIAINGSGEKTIMAYPIEFEDYKKGYVSIKNYKNNKCFPQYVHEDDISYMAMDYYGLLLATSNEKGTLIRIHSCKDGTLLQECKRGKEKAEIIYICFDINYKYMGVSSDRKTIHIWKLDNIIERKKKDKLPSSKTIRVNDIKNEYKRSISAFNFQDKDEKEEVKIKEIKFYKTETSFAKVKLDEPNFIFCFMPNDILIIVTQKGFYYKAIIEKKGGECYLCAERSISDIKEQNETKK